MKTRVSIILCLIIFLSFSNYECYAQSSNTMKLATPFFKKIVKRVVRGVALNYLMNSKNAATIEGGFYSFYDDYGNPFVAFAGKNISSKTVIITFYAVNDYTREQRSNSIILSEGECFYYGLPHGWRWLSGEKMIIKYSNGDRVYWKYD